MTTQMERYLFKSRGGCQRAELCWQFFGKWHEDQRDCESQLGLRWLRRRRGRGQRPRANRAGHWPTGWALLGPGRCRVFFIFYCKVERLERGFSMGRLLANRPISAARRSPGFVFPDTRPGRAQVFSPAREPFREAFAVVLASPLRCLLFAGE